MLKTKDILDEKNKKLRKISKEVTFPLDEEDKKTIKDIIEYLTNSQIEELDDYVISLNDKITIFKNYYFSF